jgi:hypothetical protein
MRVPEPAAGIIANTLGLDLDISPIFLLCKKCTPRKNN